MVGLNSTSHVCPHPRSHFSDLTRPERNLLRAFIFSLPITERKVLANVTSTQIREEREYKDKEQEQFNIFNSIWDPNEKMVLLPLLPMSPEFRSMSSRHLPRLSPRPWCTSSSACSSYCEYVVATIHLLLMSLAT